MAAINILLFPVFVIDEYIAVLLQGYLTPVTEWVSFNMAMIYRHPPLSPNGDYKVQSAVDTPPFYGNMI